MLLLLGLIGLACTGLSTIHQYRSGRLKGAPLVLTSVGLALWAIGLASSIATLSSR